MKVINRVEHRENRVWIQVTTTEEVGNAIMKENAAWFKLAYR